MAETLVVIPARGGSKGVLRKNLQAVAGVPLLVRAIRVARAASHVSRVVVSTDDVGMAEIAEAHGATVVRRPAELSGDSASSESAVLHALDTLAAREGYVPTIVALLQCTSPFVTADEVDGTIGLVARGEADSAFAAAPFHHFLWKRSEGGIAGINHMGRKRARRQDREPEFLEAGSIYAMSHESFRHEQDRFCGRNAIHEVAADKVFEIDTWADLERANALAGRMDHASLAERLPRVLSSIVFDFDGVFTDNGVHVAADGTETVRCDRGDGMGLDLLRDLGVPMLVLSKEQNPVVTARCRKLKINVLQGVDRKPAALKRWLHENALSCEHMVYVGNDINDLGCMEIAGCAAAPADAHPAISHMVDLHLRTAGGRGAVRELADLIVQEVAAGRVALSAKAAGKSPAVGPVHYAVGDRSSRPWGSWEVIAAGAGWIVKRIEVVPGGRLSLQTHEGRHELWVIAEGSADVWVGDQQMTRNVGESVSIPRQTRHRLSNPGNGRLVVFELQSGPLLDENDIVRHEDIYGRN
jgi:YrbI family 3-deoxy-D-manno-octulosonate 8-phosphate phosphatase